MKHASIASLIGALLAMSALAPATGAQAPAPDKPAKIAKDKADKPDKADQTVKADKKSPYVKLAAPWPEPERLRERRVTAEGRPLFRTTEPLAFTLTADFKAINKDRTPNSTKRYPGTLLVAGTAIPVTLRTRGHFRLRQASCANVPLRVEFAENAVANTVFEGQRALKLVTHCRDNHDYEQYTLHEHLIYRLFNLLTPRSFRARLAKTTYVESTSGVTLTSRYSMFLEDDDDVAKRMEGRIVEIPNVLFRELDAESLNMVAMFEYMIANTDYSIIKLHNIRLIQNPDRMLRPVPYDFDFSGLVDTRYSSPDKKLGIEDVRQRLYRGPCRTGAELEPVLAKFRAAKADVMALYDTFADLDAGYRRQAKSYLEEFYSVIEKPDRVKRELVDGCTKGAGM